VDEKSLTAKGELADRKCQRCARNGKWQMATPRAEFPDRSAL